MLEKRSNSRTVFGHNPPGHEVKMVEIHHPLTAVPSAALCVARQFQLLTVAQQSSDLKANSVGERCEVVDDDDVRRSRCAGDAL